MPLQMAVKGTFRYYDTSSVAMQQRKIILCNSVQRYVIKFHQMLGKTTKPPTTPQNYTIFLQL